MAIVIFLSISILFVVSALVTRRSIHLFEGIILWCFLLHIHNNFVGIVGIDYQLFTISEKTENFLSYDLIRTVIVPLSIILFLELNSSMHELWKKLLCWFMIIHLFIGIEYFSAMLGVLSHSKKWNVGWSYISWTATVLLAFWFHKLIRYIARKEVII